jgi:hypothetical protein
MLKGAINDKFEVYKVDYNFKYKTYQPRQAVPFEAREQILDTKWDATEITKDSDTETDKIKLIRAKIADKNRHDRQRNIKINLASASKLSGLNVGKIAGSAEELLLEWISECGTSGVTVQAFEKSWQWLNETYIFTEENKSSNLTLYRLEILGHIEVDWSRRRIYPARLTASEISNFGNIFLVSGMRTRKLKQVLNPDNKNHDSGPLAGVIQELFADYISPTWNNSPISMPSIVYLHFDPLKIDTVREKLNQIGIPTSANIAIEIFSKMNTWCLIKRKFLRMS